MFFVCNMESVIHSPLSLIQRLFEQNYKVEADWGVTAEFARLEGPPYTTPSSDIQEQGQLDGVPFLDRDVLSSAPPNSLVRCRLMVQDCFDPEYFGGVLEECTGTEKRLVHCKYQDSLPFEVLTISLPY